MPRLFRVRQEDGSIKEVLYKNTPVEKQFEELRAYGNRQGWRQSEIAMWLGNFQMHPKQRLKTYRSLVLIGEIKQ